MIMANHCTIGGNKLQLVIQKKISDKKLQLTIVSYLA